MTNVTRTGGCFITLTFTVKYGCSLSSGSPLGLRTSNTSVACSVPFEVKSVTENLRVATNAPVSVWISLGPVNPSSTSMEVSG